MSDVLDTILIREADAGAIFEYVPFLRTETDPGHGAVEAVLTVEAVRAGERTGVRTLRCAPGSLVLFRG